MNDKDTGRWFLLGALAISLVGGSRAFGQSSEISSPPEDAPDLAALELQAEAGDVLAQTRLGDRYSSVADYEQAVIWYRKAAAHGSFEAQLSLASCYLAGQGVEKSPLKAAKWLRAAAASLEQSYLDPEFAGPAAAPASEESPDNELSEARAAKLPANGRTTSRIQRVLVVQVVPPELEAPTQPLRLMRATP